MRDSQPNAAHQSPPEMPRNIYSPPTILRLWNALKMPRTEQRSSRTRDEPRRPLPDSGISSLPLRIQSRVPSQPELQLAEVFAEIEMWDRYATDGAQFDAGNDQSDGDVELERLRRQGEVFGLMNAEAMARKLGFGSSNVGNDILGEEEEEDFLSEIMANAGERQSQVRFRPNWEVTVYVT
ncbi:hypothetical protein B0H14DRAFT_2599887 [Mycena olivaceomarginata]|nr:hypothetical protein B0H14DRAFT_2599887 [Mycena olivaceomarginata]